MPTPRSKVNTRAVLSVVQTQSLDNESVIRRYLRYRIEVDGWSRKTISVREVQLEQVARLLPVDLTAATEDHLVDWYRTRTGTPETRASYVSAVNGLYVWMAVYERPRIRTDNPAAALRRPKIPPAPPRPIRDRDYDFALACALARPEMYVWFGLMGCSGLRACEIAWLQVGDVEQLEDGSGMMYVLGKRRRRRYVPVGRMLLLTMLPFLHGTRSQSVFTREDGSSYTPESVSQRVNRFLKVDCDVKATGHQLRHRFGTDYHRQDPDLFRQAALMGHSSLDMTRRYTEVSPIEAARYVEELTRRRFGSQPGRRAS